MKKQISLGVFWLFFCALTYAQQVYKKISIKYENAKQLKEIYEIGEIDHAIKGHNYLIADLEESQVNQLISRNYEITILDQDIQKTFQEKLRKEASNKVFPKTVPCTNAPDYTQPVNYKTGSMAGYLTYAEVLSELNLMKSLYPNLITLKSPIANFLTHEGRPIYYVKISDNPNVQENENRILYTALHHAREPGSMMQLMYFMWYLLENYNSSPTIKKLVDNTEIYIVPVVNPDGYLYNQTTNPNGGGLWRKNRRNNGNSIYGVDINRNYGYQWGVSGSYEDLDNQQYRGPSAFSEPETQAIKWLCENRNFKIALNNHNYGDFFLYPFGYSANAVNPDLAVFRELGVKMTEHSYLEAGNSVDFLYETPGWSDDWMYGEQTTKPKIFAYTPEIGKEFWDTPTEVLISNKKLLHTNITALKLLGSYATFNDHDAVITSIHYSYNFDIKSIGLQQNSNFTVNVVPVSNNIVSVSPQKNYSGVQYNQLISDNFQFVFNSNLVFGDIIEYNIVINNGNYDEVINFKKYYGGVGVVKFYDDFSSMSQWNVIGGWGLISNTEQKLTENYNNQALANNNYPVRTNQRIDLRYCVRAYLTYDIYWNGLNPNFVTVQVSETGVNYSWTSLCGKYTMLVNGRPVYYKSSNVFNTLFRKESIDLSDYCGTQIYLRFLFHKEAEGGRFVIIDNVKVTGLERYTSLNTDEVSNDEVRLYPNPVVDKIYLKNLDAKENYEIYFVTGQLVKKGEVNNNEIHVEELQKGDYVLVLKNKNIQMKFIKK